MRHAHKLTLTSQNTQAFVAGQNSGSETAMGEVVGKTRDPVNDIVRDNLKTFREAAGLTQEQAAALAGVPIDSLRRWENKGGIKVAALMNLAEVYGRQVDHFSMRKPPEVEAPMHRVALMQIDKNVDPDIIRRIQKLIDEANGTTRDAKKGKK